MLATSMPGPSARICWAWTLCGGSRSGSTIGRSPADPLLDLAVGKGEHPLLREHRVLVGQVVRGEQHRDRVVDELELLHRQHGFAVLVEVEPGRESDSADGRAGCRRPLGVEERPELLADEPGDVGDDAGRRIELGDRDEDRRCVEGLARDVGEVQVVERVDHRRRRVRLAEEGEPAALVPGGLR